MQSRKILNCFAAYYLLIQTKKTKKMKFDLTMFISVAAAVFVGLLLHDTIGKKITDKVNDAINK